ncbi:MAG: hypothetical protein H6807_17490 [Planctomycetes bacterium]|nr:hypothetical protein [Planctomycetota bacterium]
MRRLGSLVLVLALATATVAAQGDGFARERNGAKGAAKDALEGKAPPALAVADWLNSEAIDLASLKGKVVVLDFWGTW